MHRASLSESGTYLIDNFSSFQVGREITLLPTNGKKGTTLLKVDDPMASQFKLPEITIGTFKAADGKKDLYYSLIKNLDIDPNKKNPAIIYLYG